MSNQLRIPPEENHSGLSFAAGLVLGGLAAATGIFLFGTKRGEKVTKDLQVSWDKLKAILEQEVSVRSPIGEKTKLPFTEILQSTLMYAAQRFQESQGNSTSLYPEKKVKVVRTVRRGK